MNNPIIYKLGLYSAFIACIASVGYSVAQILQVLGYISFPADALLIYGFSLCIAPPYLISISVLHHITIPEKRIWTLLGLAFGVMYVTYVVFVYAVQLYVAIPLTLQGKSETIGVLVLTERSLFWTLDGLGYICMGISTFFLAFTFHGIKQYQSLRNFLIANGMMTPVVAFVYFYPYFSVPLLLLASPWVITVPGSLLLLSLFFRSEIKKAES